MTTKVLLAALANSLWAGLGWAAASGITVSPTSQELAIRGDGTSGAVVTLTNNTGQPKTLDISTVDFQGLNDSGGLVFGGNSLDVLERYRLAKWLRLSEPAVSLAPGQTKTVNALIDRGRDMEPGGHYGAVLFRVRSGNGSGNVSISQSVASLILAVKNGEGNYRLSLAAEGLPTGLRLSHPKTAPLTFASEGNAHVVPRGTVTVTNPFGATVAESTINVGSKQILPGSKQAFSLPYTWRGASLWPGRYTATVNYRHDATDQVQTARASYWYVSPVVLVSAILTLAAIVFAGRRIIRQRNRENR